MFGNNTIFQEIEDYGKENGMMLEAIHASFWVLDHKFLKRNFLMDMTIKPLANPAKQEKYRKALDDLKNEKLEKTQSMRETLKYFEKRYLTYGLDDVFQREGVFTYRTVSKILESEYIPESLYNKILSYLLQFEDSLML